MIAAAAYFAVILSAIVQAFFLLADKEEKISHFILLAASAALLTDIIIRSIQIRFIALTNTYESLVFLSAVITLILFIYRIQKRIIFQKAVSFSAVIITVVLMSLASSPLVPGNIQTPVPVLRSAWLVLHVSFAFIGEAFFAVSFGSAVYSLLVKAEEKKKTAERFTSLAISAGYPVYTAGALIFGAVWAEQAWGAYWSWDPKEVWALITWLVYTVYLHAKFIRKFNRTALSWIAVAGFLLTMFTFFGVNYLLSGFHSYG